MSPAGSEKLFDSLLGIAQDIGEIKGELRGIREDISAGRIRTATLALEHNEDAKDAEIRLRALEKRQYMWAGASSVVGATVALLFGHTTFKWPF